MENNKEIASTILNQLGGRGFLKMTGSFNLVIGQRNLKMKLRKNKSGATHLIVELDEWDTYEMKFFKISKIFNVEIVEEYGTIYNEELQDIFTEVTGFDCVLPRVKGINC